MLQDVEKVLNEDDVIMGNPHPPQKPKKSKQIWLMLSAVLALLLVFGGLLFFCNRKSIVASVTYFFDSRPNLTEVTAYETLATQEITQIEIVAQSAEYPDYTEEKTITDPAEIAAFVDCIAIAKMIEDETPDTEQGATDCYTFYTQEETITLYTKANDASFLWIEGAWQEIDPIEQVTFYESYLASTAETVIIDTNGLVFYPQAWQVGATELSEPSYGIDVSYFQGEIDWAQVAEDGVDFAIIRIGIRYAASGVLAEDPYARYNLQEATKYGIAVGVYLFSTAITEAEIQEEVDMTLDIISGYGITYPVVYDCEMFHNSENRNSELTAAERSALADLYLSAIEAEGYTGMFYASKNDLEVNAQWETNYLQSEYRIWVAQYPGDENEATPQGSSSYSGRHEMWQYTCEAIVAGIDTAVDRNIAYFSYSELATPKGEPAEEVLPDYDALAKMETVNEQVTAKERANVRSSMDSTDDSNLIGSLSNGEIVTRVGVGGNGWSKIEYNGGYAYVVTNLLTTDISDTNVTVEDDDEFDTVFDTVNEQVTAKEVVNLRNMPSVTDEASVVVASLTNGEVITRTGVSDEGFSRVEYQGQTLYCVSSYLEVVG